MTTDKTQSNTMESQITIELKNIDPEDIEDVLSKVEQSFGFQFDPRELSHVKSFGELCDIVTGRVQGYRVEDCTTQQAFYRIRHAIAATQHIDATCLTVHTRLNEIFPRKHRRKQVKIFETHLGLPVKILRPKHWITVTLMVMLFASFTGLFFNWQAGLACLVFTLAGLWTSVKFGKELDLPTIGALAGKLARENYKDIRRNKTTINPGEVVQKVKELFISELDLKENVLTNDAMF